MTPLQFAQAECPNLNSDGTCTRTTYDDQGRCSPCHELEHCVLKDKERCSYFEDYVAPMANMVTDPMRKKLLWEALKEYSTLIGKNDEDVDSPALLPDDSPSQCPDCGKRKPKGNSRCPLCAKKRRRRMNRERQNRKRLKASRGVTLAPPSNPIKTMVIGGAL